MTGGARTTKPEAGRTLRGSGFWAGVFVISTSACGGPLDVGGNNAIDGDTGSEQLDAAALASASDSTSSSSGSSSSTGGIDLSSNTEDGSPTTVGQEDLCDGIDNDDNGIIDDVDLGNDGICDCLRIATLGASGQWGDGDVFASWLNTRSNNGAVDLADAVLTPELLGEFQLVVAQNLLEVRRAYSPEEVNALGDWLRAGGGFMTLVGYGNPEELENVNTLLAPLALAYEPEPVLDESETAFPVTQWNDHPVAEGITQIGAHNGYPVNGGSVIATEQGVDLLTAQEVSEGRVLMWGDEWITYNSEWTEHPEFQVELFWVNAVKWLTPANNCQVPIPEEIK